MKGVNDMCSKDMCNHIKDMCNRILVEQDFYPPSDDRVLKSNVEDIVGGDNFADYCEYIFDLLEEEEYYD